MKSLYIIKAGTTFPALRERYGDFDRWTAMALDETDVPLVVIDVEQRFDLPAAADCAGVVVTGSHAMVTDNREWSVRIEAWLPELIAAEVPFFGICYGHQLLGRAMGGDVDYHPRGKEIGTVAVRRLPASDHDLLFQDLPEEFPVHATHSQSVLRLPDGATLLAENTYEPHHAFRLGRCAWGVQFHPEYDTAIMRSYIEEQAAGLADAGQNVAELIAGVRETLQAAALFRGFSRYVATRLEEEKVPSL